MAENSEEKAKEPSISDLKRNIEGESSAGGTSENEGESLQSLKTEDDFRRVGKISIENIKASLLASSASAKYAASLEDPYMKAYKYLEENKVLALLEDLITYTAFHRPSEPLPFMAKLVKEFYADSKQKDKDTAMDVMKHNRLKS